MTVSHKTSPSWEALTATGMSNLNCQTSWTGTDFFLLFAGNLQGALSNAHTEPPASWTARNRLQQNHDHKYVLRETERSIVARVLGGDGDLNEAGTYVFTGWCLRWNWTSWKTVFTSLVTVPYKRSWALGMWVFRVSRWISWFHSLKRGVQGAY